ncbi:serine/threonine-protein kinase [Paraliomyxa miuraensis]|uniref:serine/threonine-protein kinase n=1 Tax=Paraliomyxa miuraensis TaxID=376150 RepID=UPI00225BE02A|nr:serine/threonine-protein kinase [Paraliomyxa miuraensis]MCX4242587.1 serine/threonine-protein kinase [Paraliomyxa miuraensis]
MPADRAPSIARYRLAERLGAGGLGVVYAALDPELGRRVAIKLIRMGSSDGRAVERLQQEAAALGRVSHPHVVSVFDVGDYDATLETRWPRDVPPVGVYIVMELCEGCDLSTWLRTERGPQEVLRVFAAAGRGLAAAHAAGVIHRDFKPANVMVDDGGRVKVLDFGLAQLHAAAPSTLQDGIEEDSRELGSSSMTMTGTVMGTPAYMSPEQHAGGRADERSDQYAFCVALTEALCGRRPFWGATVAELHEAKRALRLDPRVREISARVRAVLERGLALDPDARWPDMAALLDALEPPRSYAAWWGAAAVAGVVGLCAWVTLGASRSDESGSRPPVGDASVEPVDGRSPSAEAQALRERAQEAWVDRAAEAKLRGVVDAVAPEPTLPEEPSLAAEVLLWRGRLADDETAAELYRRAFFLAREADVPSSAARAAIAMTTAIVGDHGQALMEWTRHAWVEIERGPEDRTAAIEVAVTYAYGRSVVFEDEQTADALELATAVVGDLQPGDGAFVAFQLLKLSSAWRQMDHPEAALWWAQRAGTLLDGVAAADHPLHSDVAEELGRALYMLDRCDEAMAHVDRALAGYLLAGDPESLTQAALIREVSAACLQEMGRLEEAIAEYGHVLAWGEGEPDVTVPQLWARLERARMLVRLGRAAEAEAEYEHALAIVDDRATDHWMRREAREELAALRGEG